MSPYTTIDTSAAAPATVSPRPLLPAGRQPRAVGVHGELARGQEREAGVERDDRLGAGGDRAGGVDGVVGSEP